MSKRCKTTFHILALNWYSLASDNNIAFLTSRFPFTCCLYYYYYYYYFKSLERPLGNYLHDMEIHSVPGSMNVGYCLNIAEVIYYLV